MGEIVTIGSGDGVYKYELPPLHKEKEILYYDLPKKQQYWRTPHDKLNQLTIRDVKKMSEKERIEYIDLWRERWANGMWFMNNGEPTYITGAHVDHLVFNKFGGVYLYYLESQRKRFYFRDLTNKDRFCDGRLWIKPRRAGLTTEQYTENIRVALSGESYRCSLQSTTLEICNRTLMKPIIDTYLSRPFWMREVYYTSNGKKPISSLQLTAATISDDPENQPLNGLVKSFPTVASAVDGDGWMLCTMDELSKWLSASPEETLEVNKKAIVNPGRRGKIDCLSTVGDSKEAAGAVKDWQKLIADSNPKNRNENGKTKSGLYKYFVSAVDSLLITEEIPDVLDKYGFIDRERAEEWIWNDINKHQKGTKQYTFALYKMPLEEAHALLSVTNQSYFRKLTIVEQIKEIREKPSDWYVRGRLEFDSKGKVHFYEDEEGKWMVHQLPYFSQERGIDTRNRFSMSKNGVFFPPPNPEGAIGYDPFRYRKEDTSSTSLSNAAIVVYKKFDYYGAKDENQYAALYLDRPDDPETAHIEAIKACRFWGYPIMHERTIESVKRLFEDYNMIPFLLRSEKDNLHGMSIDNGGKVVKNALDIMVARFSPPQEEGDVDHILIHPFIETLEDMDNFDIGNTQKFDSFMAMVQLEYGLKQIQYSNVSDSSGTMYNSLINEIIPKRN